MSKVKEKRIPRESKKDTILAHNFPRTASAFVREILDGNEVC